jgi:p-hydroxybenzoate 3-monooxygenase
MIVKQRTQVGIVGAGPAGLLLSHLLALAGVDSIVVENRSRAYCEARQRAGMLESTTVELLRAAGLGQRLDAEGLEHDGIYLQFAGERHHVNFRELTGGRWVTIYAQTEIVKDLIQARLADGGGNAPLEADPVPARAAPSGGQLPARPGPGLLDWLPAGQPGTRQSL